MNLWQKKITYDVVSLSLPSHLRFCERNENIYIVNYFKISMAFNFIKSFFLSLFSNSLDGEKLIMVEKFENIVKFVSRLGKSKGYNQLGLLFDFLVFRGLGHVQRD